MHSMLSQKEHKLIGSYLRAVSFVYQLDKLVKKDALFVEDDSPVGLKKLSALTKTLIFYLNRQMPFIWEDIHEWYGLPGEALFYSEIENKIKKMSVFLSITLSEN